MTRRCPLCGKKKHRQSKTCRKCFFVKLSTPEARANLSAKRKGKPSYVRTDEHRAKLSASLKGKKKSYPSASTRPEVAAKIAAAWDEEKREAARERGNQFKEDPEWRLKVSSFGEDNPMWKGGAAESEYAPGFDNTLKRSIRERDDYTCQLCGITEEETGCAHSIHHIDYTKDNHHPDNLATTCKGCNSRVNTNESVWYGYFVALADARRQLGKNVLNLIGRKIVSQHVGHVLVSHDDAPSLCGTTFESVIRDLSSSPVT